MVINPIWKDYYVTLGTGDYFNYTIWVDGVQVYSGRAYSKSGEYETISVKINDIVADYMERAIPNFGDPDPAAIPPVYAVVKVGTTEMGGGYFFADWSYDLDYNQASDKICFPIDGWIANGQTLLYSDLGGASDVSMHITYQGPHPDFQPWTGPGHGSFNNDFLIMASFEDVTLSRYGVESARVFAIDLSQYSDLAEVWIAGHTWKVWPGCSRYVLHYINAYGGWDSLLIRGSGKQTDSLKRYTRKVQYNNGISSARGTDNYVSEITPKYVLHPGPMTEKQAARMHHLLNSQCVYLEDMQEGEIFPVVLTNNTSEHKTWSNNGWKLIEYTIEAELAQDRIRR